MMLLLTALGLLGGSALLALGLAARSPRLGQGVATLGALAAAAVGLVPVVALLGGGPASELTLAAGQPLGTVRLGADALSAFFLAPLLVLGAVAAVYGPGYLAGPAPSRAPALAAAGLNALIASMIAVLTARGWLLFVMAWEAMALTSYLLVVYDHARPDVRRAGFVYLVAGHVGVGCLIALFLLLDPPGGALDFEALAAAAQAQGPRAAAGLALLAGVGFGVKAGLVPLHVWLPEAHAAAPSHVSALMSGVLIKLGLYGLLRLGLLLQPPPAWGLGLIAVGLAGALYAILLALSQRDLKRVLAYSSVENVGVILAGLGLAMWARGEGLLAPAALALCGALLHVWNHAAMKGLMFLCAGAVQHAAGTRDLERLGGLLRRLRWTGPAALIGAAAMAALPPLPGFASEWLIYLGLGRVGLTASGWPAVMAMVAIGALALVGALAALTFARLAGIALLGEPRTAPAREAHEPGPALTGTLWALAAAVIALGVLPGWAVRALAPAATQVLGGEAAAAVAEASRALAPIAVASGAVWLTAGLLGALLAWRVRRPAPEVGTWDCGYAAPTARMQYTARSFSQLVTSRLLPPALRPLIERPPLRWLFPVPIAFAATAEDPLTRRAYEPFLIRWADRFARIRWMQQGVLHVYLLYILVVVTIALGWSAARGWGAP